MKKSQRSVSLLLAAAMLVGCLSGCGGGDTQGSALSGETGRFTETEIALPEGISDLQTMQKLEDGSIAMVAQNSDTYCLLHSSDMGENWDVTPLDALAGSYVSDVAIAPDGTVALFHCEMQEDESWNFTLYTASLQGESKHIAFPTDGNTMLKGAAYDSGGNLFVLDTADRLQKVNPEDGSCTQPFDTNGTGVLYFGIAGQTLCAVHEDGIMLFDTETGKALDDEDVLNQVVKNTDYAVPPGYDRGAPMIFCAAEDGSILFVNHEGIFQHAIGGSVNEQLVNGELTSLNDTSMVLLSAAMVDANNILVAVFIDGGGEKLLHFTYDASTSTVPETELRVYALEDSDLLRQAVTVFQKKNPDCYVKLEIGTAEDNGVTAEDALKVLNTDIMAGKGPDVLILDGMPLESYIEKNILEDISDIVDEVDQQDGLFANVRDAYRQDGKQYAMPMRFYTSIVTGDKATVAAGSSLRTFADRAESLKSTRNAKYVMMPRRADDLLYELFYVDSASWTKQDGSIDADKLRAYFTQAKRLYALDDFNKDEIPETSYWGTGEQMYGSADALPILMGMTQAGFGTLTSMSQVQRLYSEQEQSHTTFGLLDTDAAASFTPYLLAGVVSGDHVDAAKQFVKELLGKEANTGIDSGFSVNRAAYQESCQDAMAETDFSIISSNSDSDSKVTVDYISLSQQQIDACTAMLESLTVPALTDRVIQNLVLEQGEKYLDGTQDLDTTVNEVQKKIKLYLSE